MGTRESGLNLTTLTKAMNLNVFNCLCGKYCMQHETLGGETVGGYYGEYYRGRQQHGKKLWETSWVEQRCEMLQGLMKREVIVGDITREGKIVGDIAGENCKVRCHGGQWHGAKLLEKLPGKIGDMRNCSQV